MNSKLRFYFVFSIFFVSFLKCCKSEAEEPQYTSLKQAIVAALSHANWSYKCLENDCTAKYAKDNCALLHSSNESAVTYISNLIKSFKSCIVNEICGQQLEPFTFPRFTQSFNALGFFGKCVAENEIIVTGLSNYEYQIQADPQQQNQPSVRVKLNWPDIKSNGLTFSCRVGRQSLDTANSFADVVVSVVSNFLGLPKELLKVQVVVNNVNYSLWGSFMTSIDLANASVAELKFTSTPYAKVSLNFSSSLAKQWQNLAQWVISKLIGSTPFAEFFYDMLVNHFLDTIDSFLHTCKENDNVVNTI